MCKFFWHLGAHYQIQKISKNDTIDDALPVSYVCTFCFPTSGSKDWRPWGNNRRNRPKRQRKELMWNQDTQPSSKHKHCLIFNWQFQLVSCEEIWSSREPRQGFNILCLKGWWCVRNKILSESQPCQENLPSLWQTMLKPNPLTSWLPAHLCPHPTGYLPLMSQQTQSGRGIKRNRFPKLMRHVSLPRARVRLWEHRGLFLFCTCFPANVQQVKQSNIFCS